MRYNSECGGISELSAYTDASPDNWFISNAERRPESDLTVSDLMHCSPAYTFKLPCHLRGENLNWVTQTVSCKFSFRRALLAVAAPNRYYVLITSEQSISPSTTFFRGCFFSFNPCNKINMEIQVSDIFILDVWVNMRSLWGGTRRRQLRRGMLTRRCTRTSPLRRAVD